ncbi:hypothetical protein [Devosia sp. FJ2-5-3]|uniref:hypothetical protein n=1 Tax=Devosia sp. FJ2-5-3 TaxID=2976680 RepID=UPI0023D83D68|nr:hypothetical protein [Devosia sp. FJ2-5-3]WEJ59057.1 hypothetical protein N0P34_03275 [Devosia sp. FJ2-5-3]
MYTDAASIARDFLGTITDAASSIANLDLIVAKAVADATGTGQLPPPAPPVFSAVLSGNTISFNHPGEDIVLTVSGTAPKTYEFTTSGAMTGTSSVQVTSAVTDIVVPAGKTLTIREADFAGISAFSGPGTIKITDPDGSEILATELQGHQDAVAGLLDATAYSKIIGTVADLTALLVTNQGISGNKIKTADNVGVLITGTTTATAAELRALEAATTGFVDASAITTLSGTIADTKLMLVTNKGTTGDTIRTADNVVVTLSDSGTAEASDLNAINTATGGKITAGSITTITGVNADQFCAVGHSKRYVSQRTQSH